MATAKTIRCALACLHLLAAGVLSFAGCSSQSALEQACGVYTSIFLQRQTMCYGLAPASDEDTLSSRQTQWCALYSGAPGSEVDPSYWTICAALADNGCAGYQCATYPAGTRQTGEPCLVNTQCASLWCKGTTIVGAGGAALPNGIQCGNCAPPLAEGDSCDVTTDACDAGLSCFAGTCRLLGLQGAPCASWNDCAPPDLVCKSTGFCDVFTTNGQPCVNSSDCATEAGCDVTTKLCTPAQYGAPGSACDDEVHCCEAGACNKAAGVCPKVLPDGSRCDPTDPSTVCDDYAQCFGGTCTIPDPVTCE